MPTWPTLYPALHTGKVNMTLDTRPKDYHIATSENFEVSHIADTKPLTDRQKQLLYECEEERVVVKACMRDLVKLKRSPKHTSWNTAEAANMSLS